jgi:hypothetical protein
MKYIDEADTNLPKSRACLRCSQVISVSMNMYNSPHVRLHIILKYAGFLWFAEWIGALKARSTVSVSSGYQ